MSGILQIKGKEYVTLSTAKGYLKCSEGRFNFYIIQGRLAVEKLGKREYVELSSLQDLLVELLAKR